MTRKKVIVAAIIIILVIVAVVAPKAILATADDTKVEPWKTVKGLTSAHEENYLMALGTPLAYTEAEVLEMYAEENPETFSNMRNPWPAWDAESDSNVIYYYDESGNIQIATE